MLVAPKFATKINPRVIKELAEIVPPWGPAGYATYKRTYSRLRDDLSRKEEWHETVERGCNGILEIGGVFSNEQIEDLAYYWHTLKGSPAGRPIWQLGTDTVRRVGGDSMQNCWHVAVNDPIDPFTFAFNQLMLGGGVGFNVLPEHVYALPIVKHAPKINRVESFDCDLIVTDNREGWVELLRRVLHAFFYDGRDLNYNTRGIRTKGARIHGFGGVASGPEDLVVGINLIAEILRKARGRKLRPTECMDIMNIIAMVVVAGNVRRSAEIAIGDPNDEEYMLAKDWSRMVIPKWRQQSNNTVRCNDTLLLPEYFWRGYEGKGEPYGLYNELLCKSYGRLTDGEGYREDPDIDGPNPCAEILLASHEACNLAEQFLVNITDVQEWGKVSALLLRACKAIGRLPFWHPKTNAIVQKNNRIGLGVTGYMQSRFRDDAEAFDAVYDHLEEEDRIISREMGCGLSIKLTTVKPSGTLSTLAGCSPGVHPAYSPFFIRRVTFAANDPLVGELRGRGYNMEPKINIDGSRDYGSMIVDFPHAMPPGTVCADDVTAIDQLEAQKFLQTHWADNSVSMTCYFRPEEVPEIRGWLRENYPHNVKTASFLLHQEHGFQQAPYEPITEDQYHELVRPIRPISHFVDTQEFDLVDGVECGTGGCPIK